MDAIIDQLRRLRSKDPVTVAKTRCVSVDSVLGVSTADIRKLAKTIGKDGELAEQLWSDPHMEAKALAILLLPAGSIEPDLIKRWVADIQDWSTCDLFVKTIMTPRADAVDWAAKWALMPDLYTRRAGLALLANYCMRNGALNPDTCSAIRSVIEDVADDDREHVRQASCWALREFGKSNTDCHDQACLIALDLIESGDLAKAWVGRCAYRELETLIKVPERRRLISRHSKTARKYID